jgi:hypothetical protein
MALENLPELLAQPTPWGLTVAQTLSIFVVAFVLFVGWVIVRIGLQLTATLFRRGCAALIIFVGGIVSFMVRATFASR